MDTQAASLPMLCLHLFRLLYAAANACSESLSFVEEYYILFDIMELLIGNLSTVCV